MTDEMTDADETTDPVAASEAEGAEDVEVPREPNDLMQMVPARPEEERFEQQRRDLGERVRAAIEDLPSSKPIEWGDGVSFREAINAHSGRNRSIELGGFLTPTDDEGAE